MKHVLTIAIALTITIACVGCVGVMMPSQQQIQAMITK
jgi:hypothetical protein